MTREGAIFDSFSFDKIMAVHDQNLFAVNKNGKYGLVNNFLDTLLPIKYDTLFFTYKGILAGIEKDWNLFSYDDSMHSTLTFRADKITLWKNEIFVYSNDKKGMIYYDSLRNIILVEPKYDALMPYKDHYLIFSDNKFGLLSGKSGKEIIQCIANEVQIDPFGIIAYYENYWKYILPNGRKIDPGIGITMTFYNSNIWKMDFPDGRTEFYTNQNSSPLIPGYDDYFYLGGEYFVIRSGEKSGLADTRGNILIQPVFEFIGWVTDSVFYYKENNLLGLLSINGQKLTPAIYSDIEKGFDLRSRFLRANINGRYGVLDRKGIQVTPMEFDYVHISNRSFITEQKNKYGLVNEKRKVLTQPVYRNYEFINDLYYGNKSSSTPRPFEFYRMYGSGTSDFYNSEGKINSYPCYKYTLGNNVIKCYCAEGMEIIVLGEKGKVEGNEFYRDIVFIDTRDTMHDDQRERIPTSGRDAVLEEDQQSGKFSMRLTKQKGYGFYPLFDQVYETKYQKYYVGKIYPDTTSFSFFGFPLVAKSFDITFSDTDGKIYNRDSIISSDFYSGIFASHGTTFDMMFTKNLKLNFTTPQKHFKEINYIGESYNHFQKIYTGGKARIIETNQGHISLWELYCRYLKHNNIWFNSDHTVKELMSEKNELQFYDGNWRVIHGDNDKYKEDEIRRFFNGSQLFNYFEIIPLANEHIFSHEGIQYGVLSRFGKIILPPIYDTIYRIYWHNANYFVAKISSAKVVYYNLNLISGRKSFGKAGNFKDGFAIVQNGNHKGVINLTEELIIDTLFKQINYLGNFYFAARDASGYCILDSSGKKVGDSSCSAIIRQGKNKILIYKNGKYGRLNDSLQYIFPPEFDTLINLESGMVYTKKKNVKSIYSSDGAFLRNLLPEEKIKGNWIIKKISRKKYIISDELNNFEFLSAFEPRIVGRFILIGKGKEYHYYNFKGKLMVSTNSTAHQEFSNHVQALKNKKEWLLFDSLGQNFYRCEADEIVQYGEWLRIIRNDSSKIIDLSGSKIEIPKNATPVRSFSEGKILCKNKIGFFFCLKNGVRLNEEYYESAHDFHNNFAAVMKNGKWGFIDAKGNQKIEFTFTSVSDIYEERFSAVTEGRHGLYSENGEQILPHVYNEILPTLKGIFLKNEIISGYYLNKNEIIWPTNH